MKESNVLSAQVVLKPTGVSQARRVIESFRDAGFEVGALVANNFSITGPASLFGKDRRAIDRLPAETQQMIETIIFPEPPAFGPGGSY